MSISTRLIDKLPTATRTKPMAMICPGAPRSGSTSMGKALDILGYNVFQGLMHNFTDNRFALWTEAANAKYNHTTTPYSAEDFEKFLASYNTISSLPAALFAHEFLANYPDAMVVLVERDLDAWVRSWNRTILWIMSMWQKYDWWVLPLIRGPVRDFRLCVQICVPAFSFLDSDRFDRALQREFYVQHNQRIKDAVPKERLLVMGPEDGWKRLCGFLGKEVPQGVPFPHAASYDGFVVAMNGMWRRAMVQAVRNVAVAVGVAAVLVNWWSGRGWIESFLP